MAALPTSLQVDFSLDENTAEASQESNTTVGNKKLPQLPRARGGMSGQEQQERMHVTERQ